MRHSRHIESDSRLAFTSNESGPDQMQCEQQLQPMNQDNLIPVQSGWLGGDLFVVLVRRRVSTDASEARRRRLEG